MLCKHSECPGTDKCDGGLGYACQNAPKSRRPTKQVIAQVLAGKGVILTKRGMWRSFKTAIWFRGESRYEVVAPDGREWVITSTEGQRPMVIAT